MVMECNDEDGGGSSLFVCYKIFAYVYCNIITTQILYHSVLAHWKNNYFIHIRNKVYQQAKPHYGSTSTE